MNVMKNLRCMQVNDLQNAVNFALNNFKAPKLKVHNIKHLTSKDEYKVRCSEIDKQGFTSRCTLYFKKSFIKKCLKWYNKGARYWTQQNG